MSTYESEHNINRSGSISSQDDSRRHYHTLSSAIDMFLTTTAEVNRQTMTGREIFTNALRFMNEEEGSPVVQGFLQALETMGPNLKPTADGVDDEFLDSLERVNVSALTEASDCPICTNKFVDNEYPLLVKLPCSYQEKNRKAHIFDLDCIAPWLKVNSTCPLCRFDVREAKKLRQQRLAEELAAIKAEDDEEDEEGWDVYG